MPYPDGWTRALKEHQSLTICCTSAANPEYPFSFYVATLDDESYEIRDKLNQRIQSLPSTSPNFKENASQVLGGIEHLTKFELVKALTNDLAANSPGSFKGSFSVQLIDSTSNRVDLGCLQAGWFHPGCSHPKCLVQIEHGSSLELEVENKDAKGRALYLHIYYMGPSWDMENILHADYIVTPPCTSNQNEEFRRDASGVWNKKLRMEILREVRQKGQSQCNDILNIFLTNQLTFFLGRGSLLMNILRIRPHSISALVHTLNKCR